MKIWKLRGMGVAAEEDGIEDVGVVWVRLSERC